MIEPDVYYQAADAVLGALGISPSPAAVNCLVAWSLAEWGGTDDLSLTNNPMADELYEPGATDWNSAGVKIYPSLAVGAQATAASLGGYPTLVQALRNSDPDLFFSAAGMGELSTWASGSTTGNLGYAATIQSIYAGLGTPPSWAVSSSGTGGPNPGFTFFSPALGAFPVGLTVGAGVLLAGGLSFLTGWPPRLWRRSR